MPLGEGPAAAVLSGQAHQLAFGHQGAQRKQLAEGPVDLAFVGHIPAPFQHRLHARVRGESLRQRHERVADAGQQRLVHRGVQPRREHLVFLDRQARLRAVLLQVADLVEHPLQLALVVAQRVLGLLQRDVAAADQRFGVALAGPALGVDDVVHVGVRHRRVVALVVPAPAVAQHVDDDVLVEPLTEVDGQLGHPYARLRVVAVDVEDRGSDHLGDVRAVLAGPGELRRRGEADLVVDDDVDGAADAVAGQVRHVQRLGDHTLAGEGGVAVQHQRHHREALFTVLVQQILLGPNQALRHRVHGLQVRRVGRQRYLNVVVAEHLYVDSGGAEVVFDVAGAVRLGRVQVALELAEDLRVGLADDVGQHVEPAAVWHRDDDFVQAVLGALVDGRVHQWDLAFGAFQREALLPDVFGLQERLESLRGVQLAQDVFLFGHSRFDVFGLDPFFQPLLLFGLEDVGVLHADVAAVRVAQQAQHVAQLLVLATGKAVDLEHPIEIPQRQAVIEYFEIGVAAEPAGVQTQRVDVGHQVAAVAVGRDQLHDAGGLVDDRVRVVGAPAHRQVRVTQFAEDLVPKAVRQQHFVDGAQEVAGLRALDDAVVVGRRQGDQLADTQFGDALLAGALELGGVLHRADADDGALAGHQPRHRVHGADGARVGQRNRHAGKIFGGELAVAGAPHDVFVGGDEFGEAQFFAAPDAGHHQRALAVFALQVDGQA